MEELRVLAGPASIANLDTTVRYRNSVMRKLSILANEKYFALKGLVSWFP
jgi:hypothetical protein